MVVNKNYSVGEQAYNILEAESMEYGANGIKSSVVVDALKWEFEPSQTQQALDSVLSDYDAPEELVNGFEHERGNTMQVSVTLPLELDESLKSESRRIYGNKKMGKYLSKIVYDYYTVRDRKARLFLEDQDPENQTEYRNLLRDNYSLELDLEELPDGFNTAKTHRQTVPLMLAHLRNSTPIILPAALVDDVTEFIIEEYTEIESERTIESYNARVKDQLKEIVNLTGMRQSADYYLSDDEQARRLIEDNLMEWVEQVEAQIEQHEEAEVSHEKIRGHEYDKIMTSVKDVRSEYSSWMSPAVLTELDETVEKIEEMYDAGDINIHG